MAGSEEVFMGTLKAIPKEIKEQILKRIKEEGVSVADAAVEHGISTKTIYNWMRNTVKYPF